MLSSRITNYPWSAASLIVLVTTEKLHSFESLCLHAGYPLSLSRTVFHPILFNVKKTLKPKVLQLWDSKSISARILPLFSKEEWPSFSQMDHSTWAPSPITAFPLRIFAPATNLIFSYIFNPQAPFLFPVVYKHGEIPLIFL